MESTRLPRFRRVAEPPPIRLTGRDLDVLGQVRKHRFLRSTHLAQLIGGSQQQLLRRLQRLYHQGHLDRPRAQLDYFHQTGSKPIVYGLGRKGARLMQAGEAGEHRRQTRSGFAGRVFLEHALMVSDVMVALELACRRSADVRLLQEDKVPLPSHARSRNEFFRWSVSLSDHTKLGVVPDAVFALESVNESGDRQRVLYFLEADRGTMPVERDALTRSSFFRKLLAYEATWSQGLHLRRFGVPRFRVVTVTSSAARVESLASACHRLSRGHGLFLFTDLDAFIRHPDVLTHPFQSGHAGRVATLLD